jgi:hypothetical protein
MQSTLTVHETDPHDIFVIEPDVVLAARPDAVRPGAPRVDAARADAPRTDNASVDPVQEALSRLAHQRADVQPKFSAAVAATPSTAAPSPAVDTTFRATAVDGNKPAGKRSGFGRLVRNTFVGFLFALVSAMAAALWTHHGHAAKQMLAEWLPPFVLAASSPVETPPPADQANAPTQTATADQASAPAAQAPDSAAPTLASADSGPSVQSMARDIASMGQQIEQLKATIEQLKASQAQMARDVAKSSDPGLRPRVATLPPKPVIAAVPAPAPVRKPKPVTQTYQPSAYQPSAPAVASTLPPPSYAAPAPQQLSQPAPSQAMTEPDGAPVVRPPLPLR